MPDFKKDDVIFYRKKNGNICYGKVIMPLVFTVDGEAIKVIEDIAEGEDKLSPPFCYHALYEKDIVCSFDGKYKYLCNSISFLQEFCQNLDKNLKEEGL